ncbi:MAG: rRNA pseudouridine synthase [Propionibacteriaceae bacterium]|jgi:23S rRNA pseudouridine2605 synthase|nr:rRNA pseudouridine synthase [Propionibacteriaceae bacterium]
MSDEPTGIRLQKVLAQAGVASRRAAEELIAAGRIEVNGHVVTEQGRRVDPERDTIRVDGSRLPPPRRHLYLVVNKPRGVVSTMDDPEGRPTLEQYVPPKQRLFHVGRLDTDTSGLILLTNDGELANRLAHPKWEVAKTYLAEVVGAVDNRTLKRLEKGVMLDDGPVRPDKVRLVSRGFERTLLEVTLHEGRSRVVRRMFDALGHPVHELSRISIGPVRLGQLMIGETRDLTRDELGALIDLVGL